MSTNIMIMVLGIVAITTFGRIYAAKHGLVRTRGRGRDRIAEFQKVDQSDPEADRMRDEIKTLKERIQVLERVITDTNSASALDREIEKLR
jgi:hypothetical protein